MRAIATCLLLTALGLIPLPVAGADAPAPAVQGAAYSHDMAAYKAIAEAGQAAAKDGKLPAALDKAKELEKAWDDGTADLKKADKKLWKSVDKQVDVVIDACKGTDGAKAAAAYAKFLELLATVPAK